jgi:hypothetical protein
MLVYCYAMAYVDRVLGRSSRPTRARLPRRPGEMGMKGSTCMTSHREITGGGGRSARSNSSWRFNGSGGCSACTGFETRRRCVYDDQKLRGLLINHLWVRTCSDTVFFASTNTVPRSMSTVHCFVGGVQYTRDRHGTGVLLRASRRKTY